MSVAFGGMGLRLIGLQIFSAPRFTKLAADQREREVEFPARRGAIFDRDGQPLAISVDLHTIFTDPEHVEDPVAAAAELAPLLGMDVTELEAKLRGAVPGDRFEFIARQVEPDIYREVKELDIPGIYFTAEPKRYYPGGQLASHVLGFVDIDGKGLAGIELQYEKLLKGEPGKMVLEQDPSGRPLPQAEFSYERPKPGRSLFMTIDKELQYFTELTLAEAVQTYGAASGTAIIMRPRTGEVLAVANVPDFDPNRAGQYPVDTHRNRAITDVYEPGSIYKIVTAAGALQEKVVTPKSRFVVPGAIQIADRTIHDAAEHGVMRMTVDEIITDSSNVGTVKIGLKMGPEMLDAYTERFGFGTPTGLDFPGESSGIVLSSEDWSGSTIGTVPLGQGVAVTPMQMVTAYATIANGGVWVAPKLVMSTMDSMGRMKNSSLPERRRVVSRKTARKVSTMLTHVVKDGTGDQGQIPGYEIAGKTGTAQKPLPGGGYGSSWVASFAGIAPARHPAIVVLVVLDNPRPYYGGMSAAPTFRKIGEFALRHLGVSPTANAEKAAREIEAARAEQTITHD
jgi:cell division protein FtsI (penicillin-binding protein 3)